jgi:hypothetical protein
MGALSFERGMEERLSFREGKPPSFVRFDGSDGASIDAIREANRARFAGATTSDGFAFLEPNG